MGSIPAQVSIPSESDLLEFEGKAIKEKNKLFREKVKSITKDLDYIVLINSIYSALKSKGKVKFYLDGRQLPETEDLNIDTSDGTITFTKSDWNQMYTAYRSGINRLSVLYNHRGSRGTCGNWLTTISACKPILVHREFVNFFNSNMTFLGTYQNAPLPRGVDIKDFIDVNGSLDSGITSRASMISILSGLFKSSNPSFALDEWIVLSEDNPMENLMPSAFTYFRYLDSPENPTKYPRNIKYRKVEYRNVVFGERITPVGGEQTRDRILIYDDNMRLVNFYVLNRPRLIKRISDNLRYQAMTQDDLLGDGGREGENRLNDLLFEQFEALKDWDVDTGGGANVGTPGNYLRENSLLATALRTGGADAPGTIDEMLYEASLYANNYRPKAFEQRMEDLRRSFTQDDRRSIDDYIARKMLPLTEKTTIRQTVLKEGEEKVQEIEIEGENARKDVADQIKNIKFASSTYDNLKKTERKRKDRIRRAAKKAQEGQEETVTVTIKGRTYNVKKSRRTRGTGRKYPTERAGESPRGAERGATIRRARRRVPRGTEAPGEVAGEVEGARGTLPSL